MSRMPLLILLTHFLLSLAIVVAATVLAALHVLDPQACVAIFGAAIGLVGGSASALGALGSAINGKTAIDTGTLRSAVDQLGQSSPRERT